MKRTWNTTVLPIAVALLFAGSASVLAQVSQETLESLSTPDKVETSIGTLQFKDGAASVETAEKVYDALAFTRALNAYNNSFRGASALGFRRACRASDSKAEKSPSPRNCWMQTRCS